MVGGRIGGRLEDRLAIKDIVERRYGRLVERLLLLLLLVVVWQRILRCITSRRASGRRARMVARHARLQLGWRSDSSESSSAGVGSRAVDDRY